ncbi:AraC family transcriptional regulator [Chryseobacterium sp. CT-SW4]|uniref:AraC family transcriptional regulator n=1 Tax=Chryseobacterium sp. SW-1 TaxID=3157343 RepID=UPI003B029A10
MKKSGEIPLHQLTSEKFQYATLDNGHPENFDDVHRHNFYEIIWFEQVLPESLLYLDFECFKLEKNQVYLILPGQVFDMKLKGERGHVLAVSKELFGSTIENGKLLSHQIRPFVLSGRSLEDCSALIQLIAKEYRDSGRIDLLKAYLKALLIIIADETHFKSAQSTDHLRLEKLHTLIDRFYISQRESDFYADALNITVHHLNYTVRKLLGLTVKKLISQRLILEAKRELSFGARSVKEIAYMLGFNDTSYFSRFFKTQTGMRPEDFKSQSNQNIK